MSSTFLMKAKGFFLTYPQVTNADLDLAYFFDSIKLKSDLITKLLVAEESHQDGNKHFHAYVGTCSRISIRDPAFWDVAGCHGNYQSARSPNAVVKYCSKDGNYIAQELVDGTWRDWELAFKLNWRDCLASAKSKSDFLRMVSTVSPRDFILSYDRILSYAEKHFDSPTAEYIHPEGFNFNITDQMRDWLPNLSRVYPERPQSMILVGDSRLGKTFWARSLGKHFYCNGLFNLDDIDVSATYGVFDDIPVELFKYQYKQWMGCQLQFNCTDKYKKKTKIIFGKPCIFLYNKDEYIKLQYAYDMDWIKLNCVIVELNNKLF